MRRAPAAVAPGPAADRGRGARARRSPGSARCPRPWDRPSRSPPTTSRSRRRPATPWSPRRDAVRVVVDITATNEKPNRVTGGSDHPLLLRRRQPGHPARGAERPGHAGRQAGQGRAGQAQGLSPRHHPVPREPLLPADGPRPAHLRPAGGRAPVRERHPRGVGVRDVHRLGLRRPGVRPRRGAQGVPGRDRRRGHGPGDGREGAPGLVGEHDAAARLVRVGHRDQRRRADPGSPRARGRRRGGDPRLAGGQALAGPRPGPAARRRAGARGPDRARLAGGRVTRHLRGAHAAARGLRRLLRSGDGRDHDQRGPRRPHDHPRGVARLVQQVAVHRALDHRGTRRRVRGARPARPGPRLPGAAGVEPHGEGRVPARRTGRRPPRSATTRARTASPTGMRPAGPSCARS